MSAHIERRRDRIQEWLEQRADRHQALARQVALPDSLAHLARRVVFRTAALTLPTSVCRSVPAWQEWAGDLCSAHRTFWHSILPLMNPAPDGPLPAWAEYYPSEVIAVEHWVRGGANPAAVLSSVVGHWPTAFPFPTPDARLAWALDDLVEARMAEITEGTPAQVYARLVRMAAASEAAIDTVWGLAAARRGLGRGWPR